MVAELHLAQQELPNLARQAATENEDASESLKSLLSHCIGQTQSLPEPTAQAALQGLASLIYACIQQSARFSPETLSVLLEFLESWHSKNEALAEQALLLLEEAFKYLLAMSVLQPGSPVTDAILQLAQAQVGLATPYLRASVFRSLNELIQAANLHACDERLQRAVELTLAALCTDPQAPDGTRFCLLVFAVCFLSPLTDAPQTFPRLAADHSASLLAASELVIQYVQRQASDLSLHVEALSGLVGVKNCEDLSKGMNCDCGMSHGPLRIQEHHVLIFFGTLPRLQKLFAKAGTASANEEGNTIAHRLAMANQPKCLDINLHGCGNEAQDTLEIQNRAGKTPADLALDAGHEDCLEVMRKHQNRAPTPVQPQAQALMSRAMGRASSVPLLPMCQAEGDPQAPSFSYIDPDTNSVAKSSQEARLQKFEAQAGGLLASGGFGNVSHVPLTGPLEERRRILQMALAQLEAASQRGGNESDRSQATGSTPYFQNPTGNIPIHSNPFAGFAEAASQSDGQLLDRAQFGMPSMSALRTSSTGSLGIDATSPPQNSLDFRPRSFEDSLRNSRRANDWESSTTPSTRMWLGNIAAHVTVRSLYDVFGRFGQLTDAAVFPARIGPLGYAFVNFLDVTDAARAYDALNNTPVPPLTGSKLLKIRYKPAQQPKPMGESFESIVAQPSSHLWLGNVLTRPNKLAIEELFCQFGTLTSVRVFPGKTFAFVNFSTIAEATSAMHYLDGRVWPIVSGTKPMVVRYQTGPQLGLPLQEPLALRNLSMPTFLGLAPGAAGMAPTQGLGASMIGNALPSPVPANLATLSGALPGMRRSSLPVLGLPTSVSPPQGLLPSPVSGGVPAGQPLDIPGLDGTLETGPDGLLPAINLSNRLNPNNMHYDKDLADLYKSMTKAEKEAMWADDRSSHQLLSMQGQSSSLPHYLRQMGDQLPTDLSMLGLPLQQASLLANHLGVGGGAIDPWANATHGSQSLWGGSLPLQMPSASLLGNVQQSMGGLSLMQENASLPNLSMPTLAQQQSALASVSSGMLPQLSASQSRSPPTLSEVLSSYNMGQSSLQGIDIQQRCRSIGSPQPNPPLTSSP